MMLSALFLNFAFACNLECQSIPDKPLLYSFGAAARSQLPSHRIKVVAWNLYKGRDPQFAEIFPVVAKDQDIILLSEVVTDPFMQNILLGVQGFGWHFGGSFILDNSQWTGTAVGGAATTFEPQVFRTFDLEPFVKTPKTITTGKFRLPNATEELLVLSIHGINWAGNDAIVRQVQDVMPLIRDHQGPILFAGDFNFKNKKRYRMVAELLKTAGMSPVKWENPRPKKQLDDAFARGIKFHRAFLLEDYVDLASDHPALIFDMEIDKSH